MMYDLNVEGAGPLIDRLSRFDRGVYNILLREIRAASQLVADDAKRYIPDAAALFGGDGKSQGWGPWDATSGRTGSSGVVSMSTGTRDLSFDGSRAEGTIKVQARKTRRGSFATGVIGRVLMSDVAAGIFATAGKVTPDSPFNRAIIERFGSAYPRALGKAWADKAPIAAERIDAAIERAKEAVT